MLADVVIDEDLFRGNEQNRSWLKMSRVHFEVNRQQGRTALLDKSSNGTFINKVRVGKEKSSRLAFIFKTFLLEDMKLEIIIMTPIITFTLCFVLMSP